MMTLRPEATNSPARTTAPVVFPTPPFEDTKLMTGMASPIASCLQRADNLRAIY
jgi:hypothetical protein